MALFGTLSGLPLSLSGELLMSFSGIQSMSGRLLGSLTNLAPLRISSALSSQSSAGFLSFKSLTLTLLGSPVSLFLAELFRGMLFKWKGENKKSHQK